MEDQDSSDLPDWKMGRGGAGYREGSEGNKEGRKRLK